MKNRVFVLSFLVSWFLIFSFPIPVFAGATYQVSDYGAVGDGVTDDGAAIQSALDAAEAAGGGTVHLAAKTYFVNITLRIGDYVTLEGEGDSSVLKRGNATYSSQTYLATNCAAAPTMYPSRMLLRNKKPNCGNIGIRLYNFKADGSQVTSVPDAVMIGFASITDTRIENISIVDAPQDALFLKNGGDRVYVLNNVITHYNRLWGNGAGINIEMHSDALLPGRPYIANNTITANGPLFCGGTVNSGALAQPCVSDSDCSLFPASTCGGTNSSVGGIGFTWNDGSVAPGGVIAGNTIYVTDKHAGIYCNGCQGVQIRDNVIRGTDTYGTPSLLTQNFLGITLDSLTGHPPNRITIKNNQVLGSGVSGDRRGILISDAGGAGQDAYVVDNIISNKNITTLLGGLEIRGFTNFTATGNQISQITGVHGFVVGSSGATGVSSNGYISGNTIDTVTGSSLDGIVIRNSRSIRIENNTIKNISSGNGIEEQVATLSGTYIGSNIYSGNSRNVRLSVVGTSPSIVDTVGAIFTFSGLPTSITDGSRVYCSDCKPAAGTNLCASGGSGQAAVRVAGAWSCDTSLLAPTATPTPPTQTISEESMILQPSGLQTSLDRRFSVDIYARSDLYAISSLTAKLGFDPNRVRVIGVDGDTSTVDTWTQRVFDNILGTATLQGSISGSGLQTSGASVRIATVTFMPVTTGNALIAIDTNSSLNKLSDGSNILNLTGDITESVSPSVSTSGAFSVPESPSCGFSSPTGISDLFQISRAADKATLFFTPASGAVSGYSVAFGFNEGDERFGTIGIPSQNNNQGVQSVQISSLDPKMPYFFKIIPVNQCAPGSWSNWLQAGRLRGRKSNFFRYFF